MNGFARHHIETPIGPLTIEVDDDALTLLEFGAIGKATPGGPARGVGTETARQLAAYFAGKLRQFDLPLRAEGTPFRKKVWQALRAVPYGQTPIPRRAPSAAPAAPTRSPSSYRATALSVPAAGSAASRAATAVPQKIYCSNMKRRSAGSRSKEQHRREQKNAGQNDQYRRAGRRNISRLSRNA